MKNHHRFNLIITSIIFILTISSVFAKNPYLNSQIEIFKDGSVSIYSVTNSQHFQNITHSQKYTSKKGDYWLFNLTTKEIFSEYNFELTLPENALINYIKTTPHIRFENIDNRIKIIGTDTNIPLNIVIQYQLKKEINASLNNLHNQLSEGQDDYNSTYFLILIILFFIMLVILLRQIYNLKTDLKKREDKNIDKTFEKVDIDILPERQKEIINILIKKKRITQKELEKIMQIPKSSISRNLKTLEIKKIIRKEKIGNTNYIFLN